MKNKLIIVLVCLFSQQLAAQNVGIGTTTPNASAKLEISSPNSGLLIPRVALTSNTDVVTIPSPVSSLLVYNTANAGSGALVVTPGFYYFNSSNNSWLRLQTEGSIVSSGWQTIGNTGTTPASNYVGTSDNQSLAFKINNTNAGLIGTNGNAFFGLNSGLPTATGANNIGVGNFALASNNAGYSNVAIGVKALQFSTNKNNLVAIGDSALYNNGIGAVQPYEAGENTAVGSKALYKNTTGSSNTATGFWSQYFNSTGFGNSSQGSLSLSQNTSGNYNTAVGYFNLRANKTGSGNSALGTNALSFNTTGSNNTALGNLALAGNLSGNSNVAMGINAMAYSSTESNVVAIGDSALMQFQGGNPSIPLLFGTNTAVGSKSLYKSITGNANTAVGSQTLYNNNDGSFNVAVGGKSLLLNTSGSGNTAVGVVSMQNNKTGADNTAIGYGTLYGNNSTGNSNTAVGASALSSNTTGSNNIALGHLSLYSNTTGSHNIAIGTAALDSATNVDNTIAIGDSALYNYKGAPYIYNTAIGFQSQFSLVNTGGNTSLGHATLYNNKGSYNTAVGEYALLENTLGQGNSALGSSSLRQSYGDNNSAFGVSALFSNTRGDQNTAIGERALLVNTLGNRNVGIGAFSLASNFTGSDNVGIGNWADVAGSGLVNAIAIGSNALVAASNSISLGSINGVNGATENTKVGIGTTTPQTTLNVNPNGSGGILIGADKYAGGYTTLEMGISAGSNGRSYIQSTKASGTTSGDLSLNPQGGNIGIHMNTPLSPLHIKQTNDAYPVVGGGLRLERNANTNHWEMATDNGDDLDFSYNNVATAYINHVNGSLFSPSDLRLKKDINPIGTVLPAMLQLQPKTYHYKTNEDGAPLSYGFIAQEVEKLFPDFVITKGPDKMKAIAYQEFTIVAIKAIQEQQAIIETQNKRIEKLEHQMEAVLKNKN